MYMITTLISGGSLLFSAISLFFVLGIYKQKIDTFGESVKSNANDIKDLSMRLSSDIKDLNMRFSKLEGGVERDRVIYVGFLQIRSPLSITEKGMKLLEESGGKEYIDNNVASLIEDIRRKTPKSLYDVQAFSKEVVENHSGDDEFIKIKNYIFRHGLAFDSVIMTLAVYLRDNAFEEIGFKDVLSS